MQHRQENSLMQLLNGTRLVCKNLNLNENGIQDGTQLVLVWQHIETGRVRWLCENKKFPSLYSEFDEDELEVWEQIARINWIHDHIRNYTLPDHLET